MILDMKERVMRDEFPDSVLYILGICNLTRNCGLNDGLRGLYGCSTLVSSTICPVAVPAVDLASR